MSQGGANRSGGGGGGGGESTLGIHRQVFTESGTYTPTTGMLFCEVQLVGGGGGAGGSDVTTTGVICGSGGGAGGYCNGIFSSLTVLPSQAIAIGGGAPGLTGSGTATGGGTTTFGALMSGAGGGGGASLPEADQDNISAGGFGGTASGGDYQITGQRGSGGYGLTANSPGSAPVVSFSIGGSGGSSILGLGGCSVNAMTPGQTSISGQNGTGFGSGGSSACASNNSIAVQGGGNGANGVVIITEYIASTIPTTQHWIVVTVNSNLDINTGYIVNSGSLVTLTMPTVINIGDVIEVCGIGSGDWRVLLNPGQTIKYNISTASTSITSTHPTDTLRFVCTQVNTQFIVLSGDGNPTIL